jgi:hypothetical protein
MFFVDCEASSLNSGSYPIEIAWVDETGAGETHLIRPMPQWLDWSEVAEKIHGISRATLQAEGEPAETVARRALTQLQGHQLVSDNPAYDCHWLSVLLACIQEPPLAFVSHDAVLGEQMQRLQQLNTAAPSSTDWHRQSRRLLDHGQSIIGDVQLHVETIKVEHRALPDAQRLCYVWRTVKHKIDEVLS